MEPRIENLPEKKLMGFRLKMSMADNKTFELWQNFMRNRNKIKNSIGSQLYSVNVFDPFYFQNFDPNKEFVKWAATEVADFGSSIDGMEQMSLPQGLYAVFIHRGPASAGPMTFQYIFGVWLPRSEYVLDNRPHFELLGEKYKNEAPDSEEEVWIPVAAKQ